MIDQSTSAQVRRIEQLLAAEMSVPIKDPAGIISPQGIDAAHRAAGLRRALATMQTHSHEVTPCQKQP